jgi:teichuronic acid biosynthesis glycosyltransferase TuaC
VTQAVWITPTYPWRDEPVGGIFFQTQARALSRLGLEVTVCCPTPRAPWPLRSLRTRWRHYADAPPTAVDEGVTVVRPRYPNLPTEPSRAMPDRFIARAAWGARAAWSGARIVHGHTAVTGLASWRLARRAGLPFILTFHGSDMNTWPDEHPERLPDLRSAAREAGAIIAVSAALARRVEAVTGVAAVHLPIGCDHRALASRAMPRPEVRRLLGIPEDRIVVLFVGNLLVSKGVRELADAVLGLGDPLLGVFVGSGPEIGYGVDATGAAGRLDYRGARPHEEIARYMSAADVLILPSYREGLPTVLVEAGSLRLPVIANGVGGIPELLGRDRGAILGEVSSEAIADALTVFVTHRVEADVAARRLHEHVVAAYDVDTNATRLLEIYRSVSANYAAPRSGS